MSQYLTIEMRTDTRDFSFTPQSQARRIIDHLFFTEEEFYREALQMGHAERVIKDSNGNVIGKATWRKKEE